jgi:hypothetical protein
MSDQQSKDLAPVASTQGGQLVPVETYFADARHDNDVVTNLNLRGREGLVRQMKVTSAVDRDGESLSDTPFPVKWWYAHIVEPVDPSTGEVQRCIRVVLMSPAGETTSFTSTGVIDSLDMIRRSLGDGPYDPPLWVRLVRIKTRHKRTIFRLEAVEEPTQNEDSANSRRPSK